MPTKIVLKILTSGEGGVGKTTLLHRYVEGKFAGDMKMTIGIQFFLKEFMIDDRHCALQLWDFGGQERFRFTLKSYVLGAKGALLMFDLTRPSTLDNLGEWISIVRKPDNSLPIILVGTKLDLIDEIQIQDDHAQSFLEKYDLFDYIKVSSLTGENVEKCFELLTRKILERFP